MTELSTQWQCKPKKKRGVICAADRSQEWLLPWWWERYSEHNNFPVTFFDFGMTEEAREWCKKKGDLSPAVIDTSFVAPRSAIDDALAKEWEGFYGWTVWNSRPSWFKKPFAYLKSPYQKGIWLDLDCEVLGSIDPLFSLCNAKNPLAMAKEYTTEHLHHSDPGMRFNGGVVVFQHGAPIIEQWAEGALKRNHLIWSDDMLLSQLIVEQKLQVAEIPADYNWRFAKGFNLGAVVLHWVGSGGKAYIRQHGGLKPALDAFYQACKGKL